MTKLHILFLCTGNSAHSQMAEAFLRKNSGDGFDVHSAGLEPTMINPFTMEVLREIDIDAIGQFAKPLEVYLGKSNFDYLITVCNSAEECCPRFPGIGERLH